MQLIDLSGDGFPDILIDRGQTFAWYRSKGAEGFEAPRIVPNPGDDQCKPTLLFSDARTVVQFADMTGDGMPDLVRIRNGEVCYWPSLGHGRFGAMIRMRGLSPFAKAADLFHPNRVRLADVDGSGTTDLIYLEDRGATVYHNLSGNSFSAGELIRRFPGVRSVDWAEVVDLKGNGTGCLVWSSALSSGRGGVLRYIDLTGGQKPHLLVATKNNMGAETRVAYAPSTKFYLRDKAAGKPWATKLPFPVHVVERVESIDHVTRQRYVQHFAYHHGYFDGQEREFRGFGMVETWDTESYEDFNGDGLFTFEQFDTIEENLHQPPVHTKSWFHTGAFLGRNKLSTLFAQEYWQGDEDAFPVPDSKLPAGCPAPTREKPRERSQVGCCAPRSTRSTGPRTKRCPTRSARPPSRSDRSNPAGPTSTASTSCTTARRFPTTTSATRTIPASPTPPCSRSTSTAPSCARPPLLSAPQLHACRAGQALHHPERDRGRAPRFGDDVLRLASPRARSYELHGLT
ncbi:MAG: hypothetical protein HC927_04710, partial [Deltaproteobacteria bacterium]|nr:hypothetical protein [Deltaproteobacteria bacterium]